MSPIVQKKLLDWCRECTESYEGVEITNFSTSWSDGLAFNALIHHFRPDLFNYGEVLAMPTPEDRLNHAFDLAEKHFGIERLLTYSSTELSSSTFVLDRKKVPIYLMLFMQAFDSEKAAEHSSKNDQTSLTSGIPVLTPKKQTGKSNKQVLKSPKSTTGIPVLSQDRQQSTTPGSKKLASNEQSSSHKSPSKIAKIQREVCVHPTSDSDKNQDNVEILLEDFCNDVENILTWLLGTEDRLISSINDDKDRIVSLKDDLNRKKTDNINDRIQLYIEAAKYAQERFIAHEYLMKKLSNWIQKTQDTYAKGETILNLQPKSNEFDDKMNDEHEITLQEAKVEIEQQIKLLDNKVEQLRGESIAHQQYLEKMIFEIQNHQIDEFCALLKKTEERLKKIIPEDDYLPFDEKSFHDNCQQFKCLQSDVVEQQQLLEAIPKFSIVEDSNDSSASNSSTNGNFIQQLEQLFERLKTISKRLNSREKFLTNFNEIYLPYESESKRLEDWFHRLEKRAKDMKLSLEEVPLKREVDLNKSEERQERSFLEDLRKRFERMQLEIMYGAAHSQAIRLQQNKIDDSTIDSEIEKAQPPLSKFQLKARDLMENTQDLLNKYPNCLICKVNENIESIGSRWNNLIIDVEESLENVKHKLDAYMKESKNNDFQKSTASSTSSFTSNNEPISKIPKLSTRSKVREKKNETSVIKIGFEEVDVWRTKVQEISEWMEKAHNFIYNLSMNKANFFEYDSTIKIEDVPMEDFKDASETLTAYKRFTGNGYDLEYFKIYSRFFNLVPDDDENKTVQEELKELKELKSEFEGMSQTSECLVKQGNKIVLAIKSADDLTYKDVEDVIISFQKGLEALRNALDKSELLISVALDIERIFDSTENMRKDLDYYSNQLESIHLELTNNISNKSTDKESNSELCSLLEQVKSIKTLILQQRSSIDEGNRNLLPAREKADYLSLCWPNTDNSDRFSWKQIECDSIHSKVIRFINDRPSFAQIDISKFQWKCLRTTLEAMLFDKSWWTLLKTCEILEKDIETFQNNKNDKVKKENAIEILLVAVKTMNEWFQEVLDVIEKYDDEDDESSQQVKPVGSTLLEPADITRLLNIRLNDLVELQKTIEGEQKNYRYMCYRSAEWIFDDFKDKHDKDLSQVEQSIMKLEPKSELIEKVQEIITNWTRLNTKLDETLKILNDLLSRTALFEAEWTQIQRWTVKAKEFIDDYLPVGDIEMLTECLIECETLKSRLEDEVYKKIQHIQNTTIEAAEIVYGQKLIETLPVVKKLDKFYGDMQDLAKQKLETVENTKKLTEEYTKHIDNYSNWITKFEQRIKRTVGSLLVRDKFIDLYEQMKSGKLSPNMIDWSDSITIRTLEKDFLQKRIQFQTIVFGTSENCLCKQLQKYFDTYGKNLSNFSYDHLMTKTFEIVESFENLDVQLQDMIKPVEDNIKMFVKLHEMLMIEEKFNENIKFRFDDLEPLRISNLAEAKEIDRAFADLIDDIENQEMIDRIKLIKSALMIKSDLFLFAIKNQIKCVVEVEQERFKNVLEFKENFKSQILEKWKIVEEFKKIYSHYDNVLENLRVWLENAEVNTLLSIVDEKCFQLDQIEKENIPKLDNAKLILAKQSLVGRIELLRRNFNKFREECQINHRKTASIQNDVSSKSDNEYLNTLDELKAKLFEIHRSINDVEIPFHQLDDPELIRTLDLIDEKELSQNMDLADYERIIIARFLEKVVHGALNEIEVNLKIFEKQLKEIETCCQNNKNDAIKKNLSNLLDNFSSVRQNLYLRKEIVEKLLYFCDSINDDLEKLENECNEIFFDETTTTAATTTSTTSNNDKDISEVQMERFKQITKIGLDRICKLKEQLDVHCIENVDLLCGIDEIGGRYDEIITDIAERYLAYDDDDDMSDRVTSPIGDVNDPPSLKMNRFLNKNSVILTTIAEENDYGTLGKNDKFNKKSEVNSKLEGSLQPEAESTILHQLQKQQNVLKNQTYSVKVYLKQLTSLKQRIHTVCTFRSGSNDSKRTRKLPISVEDELHRLNKSLNEFRVSYEYSLCIATILGCLPIKPSTIKDIKQFDKFKDAQDNESEDKAFENYLKKWNLDSYEHDVALLSLKQQFCDSSIKFLSLHRHWWAVRDATLQFNFELRRLADWFENVELQLTNGRLTTVVMDDDPNACFTFDLSDLNWPCIARTQLLLITQLRTHVPVYAKLNVLYARLVESFTPEDDETHGLNDSSQAALDGRKAMLDACARIEHEWKQINTRWNTIIRELTWRRECLLALAKGKTIGYLSDGQPYKRKTDADFDKVLDEFLRYELQLPSNKLSNQASDSLSSDSIIDKIKQNSDYQLKQLQKWFSDTEESLKKNSEQNIIDSVDSAAEVFQNIKQIQLELSRHYLNWFVFCKEPFIDGKTTVAITETTPHLDANERNELTKTFEKLSSNLFEICYFAESFMTCYSYVCQLTKIEFDWVVTSHEHLNLVDDYLNGCSNKSDSEIVQEEAFFPFESLMFIDELKNTLIKHENNIEQISIMAKELRQQATNLSLKLNLDDFDKNYEKLSALRDELLGRFRSNGYTVWAAVHHLLRQSWNKLNNYKLWHDSAIKASLEQATSSSVGGAFHKTGSLRSTSGYPNSSLHRQRHAQRQEQKTFVELCSYYQVTLAQFQRWFELESFVLQVMCAQCEKHLKENVENSSNEAFETISFQHLLRRFEDFCCELSFADLVLGQVALCFEQSVTVTETSSTTTSVSEPGTPLLRKNIPGPIFGGGTLKNANRVSQKPEHSVSPSKIATNSGCRRQTSPNSLNNSLSGISTFNGDAYGTDLLYEHKFFNIQRCLTIKNSIMERIRGLQRDINDHNQRQAMENLYDTVADALANDDPTQSNLNGNDSSKVSLPSYNKPFESSSNNSSNLDSQRQEIDSSITQLEKKLSDFTVDCNNSAVPSLSALKSKVNTSGSNSSTPGNRSTNEDTLSTLRKQLTIVSTFQSELSQNSTKLQELRKNIETKILSFSDANNDNGRKLSDGSKTSKPYMNHLEQLREETNSMQSRINELYLTLKCKMRSLQEMLGMITNGSNGTGTGSKHNSASSRINLSGMNHGLDLGIEFHNTSSSVALCSSGRPPKTAPKPNRALLNGSQNTSNGTDTNSSNIFSSSLSNSSSSTSNQTLQASQANSGYLIHEQTEKRFQKWLSEIEQSLEFIEKRMLAESSGKPTEEDADPLYTNVSEMQQMHLNYFEKVKIMQREIEQKRADHRILMELLETSESETSDSTSGQQQSNSSNTKVSPRRPPQTVGGNVGASSSATSGTNSEASWIGRFRTRVEQLNNRWNSIRLRVLTLRSRLESTSLYANSVMLMNTTTTPSIGAPPIPHHHQQQQQHQNSIYQPLTLVQRQMQSMYTMNGSVYGILPSFNHPFQGQDNDASSTITATVAFNSAAMERGGQLLLSLRELVEWMIKRQTEFEQQQANHSGNERVNAPIALDVSNVLQQKQALLNLRSQLTNKRSIIDSTLMACHNLLRRLSSRRVQENIYQNISNTNGSTTNTIPNSVSMQSTIDNGDNDMSKIEQLRNSKRAQLADLELSISREIQRLMEVWNSLQIDVEVRLQRLDEAHLRLADLQRALEELGAKLHEAELNRAKWTPLGELTVEMISPQLESLRAFNQIHVAPVARDSVSVNELAARLTGRNVPLSHSNLKSLEEITTRVRLLQLSVDERARDLERIVQEHGSEQQDFLTKAVEEPWERAVTSNKLPCYINHTTALIDGQSPKYLSIISSLSQYNVIRYAAYRTAFKLRTLQTSLGLDKVTYAILNHVFEQKEMFPGSVNEQSKSNPNSNTNTDESSYELKVIGVTEVVSCLKMIFDMVAETIKQEHKLEEDKNFQRRNSKRLSFRRRKSDADKSSSPKTSVQSPIDDPFSEDDVARHVDLCLNWIIALYDSPNRSGYVRQFSFQIALILLSKTSLEQKFQYIFKLIADDNNRMDGRKLGLLLYDCLRLPKVLGEVAAFGGTNIEPSVRSCLHMSNENFTPGVNFSQFMAWIRAEPQSLVWMLLLHRFRQAENSRHPAKCNICKAYPIVGFRYRCLKCFNYDLCQNCFLTDACALQKKTKHKISHPMQEYCMVTTSGEDMRDFGKILRNKFKSSRNFKRQEPLGYLPVQSLHEGDRIEDSFVPQLPSGSFSHNPSANTTPVHTLQYSSSGRKINSPGAITQQDMNFMDLAGPSGRIMNVSYASATSSSSMVYPSSAGSVRRHNSTLDRENPYGVRSPFDRRLIQYQSTPTSPMAFSRSTSRTMERAKDLSEHKMNNERQMIESPSEMLSKIAADQRCELEHIIQRLEEENKSLVCEYNQLKEEEKENSHPTQVSTSSQKVTTNSANSNGDASLYEKIMNSLERRKSSAPIGYSQNAVEEKRRLTENESLLETRKEELEKCNQHLENQLSHFKNYANFTTEMDAKSKLKLANTIAEMQEHFKNGSTGPPLPPRTIRSSSITSANSGDGSNNETSTKLHSAAQHLNQAMDSLVDAVIDRQHSRANDSGEKIIT